MDPKSMEGASAPSDPTLSEPMHCAACTGTDYLGRPCRGRSCPRSGEADIESFMAFMGGVVTDFDPDTKKRLLDRAEEYASRLAAPRSGEGLEEAWAEAEAALFAIAPQGEAVIEGLSWEKGKDGPPDARYPDRYNARAYRWDAARPWHRTYADGPTRVAALSALAARLRENTNAE